MSTTRQMLWRYYMAGKVTVGPRTGPCVTDTYGLAGPRNGDKQHAFIRVSSGTLILLGLCLRHPNVVGVTWSDGFPVSSKFDCVLWLVFNWLIAWLLVDLQRNSACRWTYPARIMRSSTVTINWTRPSDFTVTVIQSGPRHWYPHLRTIARQSTSTIRRTASTDGLSVSNLLYNEWLYFSAKTLVLN